MLPTTTCNAAICTCSMCGRELAPPELPVLLFEVGNSRGRFVCQAHCPVPICREHMGATWCAGCGRMLLLNAPFQLQVFCCLGCRDRAQPEAQTPAPRSHGSQYRACEMCATPLESTRPDAHCQRT